MTIKAQIALVKKELIEHKGAFFIAPAVLNIIFFVLILLSLIFTDNNSSEPTENLFGIFYIGASVFFGIYLAICLFFYFADAFSSDTRDNNMLFWKSLPMSDLNILGIKFFTGIVVVPLIIIGWIVCASILSYLIGLLNFTMFEDFLMPWTALIQMLELTFYAIILFLIFSLWLAPFYAWVSVLSGFFKKWSIALAFIIPFVLITMEKIFFFGTLHDNSILGDFLYERIFHITNDDVEPVISDMFIDNNTEFDEISDVLWAFVLNVKWVSLIVGLFVSAVFVFIASEYRKRFIQG